MMFSKRSKSKQELMTLLEPRRLMSLTGGIDYTPPLDTAPTQITHTFGYEHLLVNNGDTQSPIPVYADFGGTQPDFGKFEAQFARAIALGTPVSFADPNADSIGGAGVVDARIISAPHADVFVSMYTSLNNSTVVSIDNASASSATSTSATLSAVSDTTFHVSINGDSTASAVSTTPVTSHALTVTSVTTATTGAANAIASNITSPVTLPTSVLTADNAQITANSSAAVTRSALQTVEQEFLTVSTLASEMISQLGRDIAIELSHLTSDLGMDSLNEQFTAHWDGWRSAAAVTGAAIATIVYIQSEVDREKAKTIPTFSSTLIEVIPS